MPIITGTYGYLENLEKLTVTSENCKSICMLFGEYLRGVRKQKGLRTSKEHFDSLGGKTTLGISLRHFQQIESDKYPPSEKLLATLVSLLPRTERRGLVLSYFNSIYATFKDGQALVEYMNKHLMPDNATDLGAMGSPIGMEPTLD